MPITKIPLDKLRDTCDQLRSRLPDRAKQIQQSIPEREFTAWTRAVKSVLADIGTEREYESLYSDRASDLHEFLLDFVWWTRKEGGQAVLACECEFGNTRHEHGNPQRVAEDFDKLLSFKAPFKLMVFDSYGPKARIKTTVEDVLKLLNYYLCEYALHIAGETYVLMDTCQDGRLWKCEITKHGRDESLSFSEF